MSGKNDDKGYVTSNEITDRVAEDAGVSKYLAEKIVRSMASEVAKTLANGKDVKISGIGKIILVHKKERQQYSPSANGLITIPARTVVSLKPAPSLSKAANGETPSEVLGTEK